MILVCFSRHTARDDGGWVVVDRVKRLTRLERWARGVLLLFSPVRGRAGGAACELLFTVAECARGADRYGNKEPTDDGGAAAVRADSPAASLTRRRLERAKVGFSARTPKRGYTRPRRDACAHTP